MRLERAAFFMVALFKLKDFAEWFKNLDHNLWSEQSGLVPYIGFSHYSLANSVQ